MPRVILTNAYDAASNRTSLKATISGTNDFQNAYAYDTLNRLTRVDQWSQTGGNAVAEKRVDFSYNAAGLFTGMARYKDTDGGSANEVATGSYWYDSYGRVTSGDTSKTRYLFTSREFDPATGLQYNRARWYDPGVGRWVSEDPLSFLAGDTNVTRHVANTPTNATDPSGRESPPPSPGNGYPTPYYGPSLSQAISGENVFGSREAAYYAMMRDAWGRLRYFLR